MITKCKYLTCACLALAVFVALGFKPAVAAPPRPVSVPVPHIMQRTSMWCWLAVAEMVVRYKHWGRGPSQCQLMEIGLAMPPGRCCRNPRACLRGGTLKEIMRIINHFNGRSTALGPPASPGELYSLFSRNQVIIARLVQSKRPGIRIGGPPPGHVVVLRGLGYEQVVFKSPRGPIRRLAPVVLINDPQFPHPIKVPYPDVISNWERSILVK